LCRPIRPGKSRAGTDYATCCLDNLDAFDHFVTEVLRAPYVRYVDDFALFHDGAAVLQDWQARMEQYLAGRRLKLHPVKTFIVPTALPATFLDFELHSDGGAPPARR
jgi:RNA-directed DNA polymerase